MKKYKWIIIFLNLVLLLVFFNYSIIKKEIILSEGKLILLELAPVDPRSLMQGDYMRLNYKNSREFYYKKTSKCGYCVAKLDSNGVANIVRVQSDILPENDAEYLIKYTTGHWSINIGAESFFFQEGEGKKFEKAKYGGIKVDKSGNSILIGLYDKNLKRIE